MSTKTEVWHGQKRLASEVTRWAQAIEIAARFLALKD
jgi:hypothetical protein